jgi:hypothetical protein
MRFLRKLDQPKLWAKYLEQADKSADAVPYFVLAELLDGCLSVYEAPDDAAAESIAAAITLHAGVTPGKVWFSVADAGELSKAGLKVQQRPGETGVPSVDALHWEVVVRTQSDLSKLIAAFSKDALFIEANNVLDSMVAIVNSNTLNYDAIAKAKPGSAPRRLWGSVAYIAGLRRAEFHEPAA